LEKSTSSEAPHYAVFFNQCDIYENKHFHPLKVTASFAISYFVIDKSTGPVWTW
jgi:hypothetical protein